MSDTRKMNRKGILIMKAKTLKLSRPVIAITGSAGKTTTKEMIASILRRRWTIFKTKANRNFVSHTRTYAKQIKPRHRAVVLEYGMLREGHIKRHCLYIQPNIAVITNVGTAHLGNLGGSIRRVAGAKSELIRYMHPRGRLFLNADDANSRLLSKLRFQRKCYTIGIKKPADYRAYGIRQTPSGMHFQCKLKGKLHQFFIPALGVHNVYNALFAIAVSRKLGLPYATIKAGLRNYAKPQRRLTTYRFTGGFRILDDSYSANPHAMKAAVDVLARMGKGRKIAVLGSMLEMGIYRQRGHRGVGRYLAKKGVDYLFTYGHSARQIGVGAIQAGFPRSRVIHCATKQELHRKLRQYVRPQTCILVKASHKLKMNETVGALRRAAGRKRWSKK